MPLSRDSYLSVTEADYAVALVFISKSVMPCQGAGHALQVGSALSTGEVVTYSQSSQSWAQEVMPLGGNQNQVRGPRRERSRGSDGSCDV